MKVSYRIPLAAVVAGFVIQFLVSGCAPTIVKRDKPFVLEKKSVVVLRQGHELPARRVVLDAESLAVTGRYSGVETRVPLRAVGKVVELDAFSGMMRGAVGGTAIGAGAGLVMIPTLTSGCEGLGCGFIIFLPVVTGLWGAGGGALVGLLRGRGASYRFEGSATHKPDSSTKAAAAVKDTVSVSGTAADPVPVPPTPPPAVSIREWAAGEVRAKDTAREPYQRGKYYLGIDYGLGYGMMPSGPDAHVGSSLSPGWFLPMFFGWNLNPRWSAGVRYTVGEMQSHYTVRGPQPVYHQGPPEGGTTWDGSFMHALEAEVRWYPQETGLFYKGSVGRSWYQYIDGYDWDVWYNGSGMTVSGGVGYVWNLWSIVNLVAGADLVGGIYSTGSRTVMIRPSVGVTFQ